MYVGREANAADTGQSGAGSRPAYHWQLAKPPLVCLFVNSSFPMYTGRDMYIYMCILNFIPFTLEIPYCETKLKASGTRNVSIRAYGLLTNNI